MRHTFQPYPIEMLEWNPMNKISQEWLALVTEADGKANAMTCSWGGVGFIWNKNACTVYVRESRYSKELLDKSEYFSCCFLNPDDKESKRALKYLGMVSGRNEDKLKSAHLTVEHKGEIPYLDEANFVILCKKMAAVPMPKEALDANIDGEFYKDGDYHTMYIGEIVEIVAR